MTEKYVVVTAVSMHRVKYAIPVSALEAYNEEDVSLDEKTLSNWASDSVTMEEVEEFSQHWLGESIVDTSFYDENEIIELHDQENDYLQDWSREKKLERINNWKIKKEGQNV